MALLIAIGHDNQFSCSAQAPAALNLKSKRDCRDAIAKLQTLPIDSIDEVLVVVNDEVVHHYGGADGF